MYGWEPDILSHRLVPNVQTVALKAVTSVRWERLYLGYFGLCLCTMGGVGGVSSIFIYVNGADRYPPPTHTQAHFTCWHYDPYIVLRMASWGEKNHMSQTHGCSPDVAVCTNTVPHLTDDQQQSVKRTSRFSLQSFKISECE